MKVFLVSLYYSRLKLFPGNLWEGTVLESAFRILENFLCPIFGFNGVLFFRDDGPVFLAG